MEFKKEEVEPGNDVTIMCIDGLKARGRVIVLEKGFLYIQLYRANKTALALSAEVFKTHQDNIAHLQFHDAKYVDKLNAGKLQLVTN